MPAMPTTWSPQALVYNVPSNGIYPHDTAVATDCGGNPVVAWINFSLLGGDHEEVYASVYSNGTFGTALRIDGNVNRGYAGALAIRENAAGNAVVVWSAGGLSDQHKYAARHTASGWAPPEDISGSFIGSQPPGVGIDAMGNIVVAWKSGANIVATRYAAGGTWEAPVQVNDPGHSVSSFSFAMSPSAGAAVVIWTEDDTISGTSVLVRARIGAAAWSAVDTVVGADGPIRAEPRIALNSTGAYAIWAEGTIDTNLRVAATRRTAASWETPVNISEATGLARALALVSDDDANMVLVYTYGTMNVGARIVEASQYVAGTGWTAPVQIGDMGQSFYDPDLAVSPSGDSVAVFSYNVAQNANTTVRAAHLGSGGWDPETTISMNDPGSTEAVFFHVASGTNGRAAAAWLARNPGYAVYASLFR